MSIGDHQETIVQRFRDGETMAQIAQDYGCTSETIRMVLKRAGVSRQDGGAHARKLQRVERVRALAREGMTRREIANAIGMDYRDLSKLAVEHDIPIESAWRRTQRDAEVVARYAEGMTQTEIATSLGTVQSQISTILRRNGIQTRSREIDDDVIRLYQSGLTGDEVGWLCECGRQKVYDILTRHGIPRRSRGG